MQLPEAFERNMRELLGAGADSVLAAIADEPVVSVRLNPWKRVATGLKDAVPWATDAFYLDERKAFTFDPLFHAGCYYVQEASSMFLEQAVRAYVTKPVVALDLCAAPGGKTTLLRSVLPEGSVVVANEMMRDRAQVLVENVVKWGHPAMVVTNNAPSDFAPLEGVFDLLVTDVPCSGEGMFRKDPVAISEWSEAGVDACWRRGRDILSSCWDCLRPGGLLVYSTCTFNAYEDEQNVRWIRDELGADVLPLDVRPEWGITGDLTCSGGSSLPVYHFLPGRTRGEGFFLAVLRKRAISGADDDISDAGFQVRQPKSPSSNIKSQFSILKSPFSDCLTWLSTPDDYDWIQTPPSLGGGRGEACVAAVPKSIGSQNGLLTMLSKHLRVLHAGVKVAEMKGRDVVPSPFLAFTSALNEHAFTKAELSYRDALTFLRKEVLQLPPDVSRGYVLVTYHGVPLGFVKNLGSRANNLYPTEWRIRTTHLPDEPTKVLLGDNE